MLVLRAFSTFARFNHTKFVLGGRFELEEGANFYRTQVYLGSDLWVRSLKLTDYFADLTDVTLADDDMQAMQAMQAMHAMQVM